MSTEPAGTVAVNITWLTATEAAKRLGVGHSRFHALVRAGRIEFQQLPTGRVYSPESIDQVRAEATAWLNRKRRA
jgi:excisionase family DNA binding protein